MKKTILYIGIAAMTLTGFTSCNDYLDMPSKEKFDSETVFEDVNKAEMAVIGCYPQTFNREFFYQLGMGTDECISTESQSNSKNQIANYVYTSSNAPTGLYNAMYKGIEYTNVCIDKLQTMKANDETTQKKLNHLLGEALCIRSANYLNLVRFFGDVPFITTPTAELNTFYSSRTSRDTIYDHIIADMQKATTLLSWESEGVVGSETERYTKNSAYGVLARIALYAAGYSLRWDLNTYDASSLRMAQRSDPARIRQLYQIAADACKAVIDKGENSLLPKYETVFRDIMEKKFDSETMLQVGQYGPQVSSFNVGYTNGIFSHSNTVFMKSAPQMVAVPTYYLSFADGDQRRDVAVCNYGYDGTKDKTGTRKLNGLPSNTIGKFRVDWKENTGVSANRREIDFPLLRYSDVLLMYAEALNELNNGATAEAVNALKQVRLRAFGGDESKVGTIPTDHDGFLKAIQQERAWELGFEGWRRTDLCRWNILGTTLANTKAELVKLANGEGKYADIFARHYAAYKPESMTANDFKSPVVSMPYIQISESEETEYKAKGYSIQDLFKGTKGFTNANNVIATSGDGSDWMTTSLFRGYTANQVEILPLNQTSVIDINKGLEGEQHPAY